MILLVAGMIPDTIVGIVLLQTDSNPFHVFARMRPPWAPGALDDLQTAGGLMWAEGDGLMMTLAVAVMIAAITTEKRRERLVGPWLQGVRRSTLAGHGRVTAAMGRAAPATTEATVRSRRTSTPTATRPWRPTTGCWPGCTAASSSSPADGPC